VGGDVVIGQAGDGFLHVGLLRIGRERCVHHSERALDSAIE
jgi:hypothetical protein